MRGGDAYVASLRDGRAVYLDGERVDDVTKHPAFVEPIRRIAETYDRAKAAAGEPALTFADPATGARHSNMWLVPRSAEDLGARRRVHRFWAEPSFGLMGRTPDHVACVLTAFSAWRHLFDRGGASFGDNVVRFYERARDEDLYVTYAIVPPQVDRSQPAHRHPEPFLHPGVVRETAGGVVVRGAHAIATSATMADWLFVSYITPLVPGDEDYAISLVMPMNAEGLRLYPRRPYASMSTSVFDYPLSSRFDEVDTTVVFNDVVVPWEHVFIYRSVETRADTERYYQSAAAGARERVKLVKLIWDFVGTEFGGRQLQYEMFYSASQPVVNRRMFTSYDWGAAKNLVDRCLGEY